MNRVLIFPTAVYFLFVNCTCDVSSIRCFVQINESRLDILVSHKNRVSTLVYVHACTHVCVHVGIHVHICLCMYVSARVCIFVV